MGIDCEWCQYWRRVHELVSNARLTLEKELDSGVALERRRAITQGINSAERLLEEMEKKIRLHKICDHRPA
jgi:hypothetical protein